MPRFLKSTEALTFAVEAAVATITLNRPERHNALSELLIDELHGALLEADARSDVNVILLQGAGKSFCAGYDLTGVYAGMADGGEDAATYRSTNATIDDDCWGMELTQRKLSIHSPTAQACGGEDPRQLSGGGTDLALSSDIVLAAEDCRIGFPAARANGTPPSNYWMYHCGPQWTKRLLFTGDTILGRDAARIGLVMDCYPRDSLDSEALRLARRIALVDAELVSAHKRVVNLAMELAGATTLQRLATELDARAHLSRGPRRTRFREDMAGPGLRTALKNRDDAFGESTVTVNWAAVGSK
ncbi:MAG: crotonase/enoyl-CoA hydratase family protein [Rhodospirillales bacterium]